MSIGKRNRKLFPIVIKNVPRTRGDPESDSTFQPPRESIEVQVGKQYGIEVKDSGEWQSLDRFSGGETDLVNLCFRVAVSELVAQRAGREIKFVVLDEVFGSQDEQRRMKILKALKSLDDLFDQICLITHAEDVKDRLENVFLLDRAEESTSTVRDL